MKTCSECRWAVFEDFGYSNYTVEGTNFSCMKSLHPAGTFDRFYGEDERLEFADKCDGFNAGEPVEIDCDRESLTNPSDPLSSAYAHDPEQGAMLDKWAATINEG